MLSRTAENLYWMSRYVERAENAARTLDVSFRMSRLPSVASQAELHWRPAVLIGPDPADFGERAGAWIAERQRAMGTFVALDPFLADYVVKTVLPNDRRALARDARDVITTIRFANRFTPLAIPFPIVAEIGRRRGRESRWAVSPAASA